MSIKKNCRFVAVLLLAISLFVLLPASTSAQDSPVKVIPVPGMYFSSQLSPDGTLLAMAENGDIQNWEVQPLLVPIRLLNLTTGEQTGLIGYADYAQSIAFSPDGKQLAAYYGVGYIYLWDIASQTLLKQISTPAMFARITFLADGKTLLMIAGSRRPELWLWNLDSGTITAIYTSHPVTVGEMMNQQYADTIAQFALSPDNTTLAVVTLSGNISLWNLAEGKETLLVKATDTIPTVFIRSLAFTPDGSRLVYYHSKDQMFHVLDTATGSEVASFTAASGSTFTLSPDGKTIVWVGRDTNGLMLTDLAQPGEPQSITLPTSEDYKLQPQPNLSVLAFTLDGRQIVFSGFLSNSPLSNAVDIITLP